MKTSEILKAAKALIDSPEKWTQGAAARDSFGGSVHSSNPIAVCFCSIGAGLRLVKGDSDLWKGLEEFLELSMGGSVTSFNDTHTHTEVMEAWDEAIQLAELEESNESS